MSSTHSSNCLFPPNKALGRLTQILVLSALIFGMGCGGKGPTNFVKGKVTLKPSGDLVSGEVVFVSATGKETIAAIGPNGVYNMNDPAVGDNKIAIRGAAPGVGAPASAPGVPQKELPPIPGAPPAAKMGVPPPRKYADPNSSGLKITVKGGNQEFDIPLDP